MWRVRGVVTLLMPVLFLAMSGRVCCAGAPEAESSDALVVKAWAALEDEDWESALEWAKRCVETYGRTARKTQVWIDRGREDRIHPGDRKILDDVATARFIQAEIWFRTGADTKARQAYKDVVEQYTAGQCWDPRGWFWRPSKVAAEKLAMYESGVFLEYGNHSSETLLKKAWEALENGDESAALGYAQKCIDLYAVEAQAMQAGLSAFPEDRDAIFAMWALNDVATAHFIRGLVYSQSGQRDLAVQEFQTVREKYSFGQCWDPRGWFWRPSEVGERHIHALMK